MKICCLKKYLHFMLIIYECVNFSANVALTDYGCFSDWLLCDAFCTMVGEGRGYCTGFFWMKCMCEPADHFGGVIRY